MLHEASNVVRRECFPQNNLRVGHDRFLPSTCLFANNGRVQFKYDPLNPRIYPGSRLNLQKPLTRGTVAEIARGVALP